MLDEPEVEGELLVLASRGGGLGGGGATRECLLEGSVFALARGGVCEDVDASIADGVPRIVDVVSSIIGRDSVL